jgi:hypothetical protein
LKVPGQPGGPSRENKSKLLNGISRRRRSVPDGRQWLADNSRHHRGGGRDEKRFGGRASRSPTGSPVAANDWRTPLATRCKACLRWPAPFPYPTRVNPPKFLLPLAPRSAGGVANMRSSDLQTASQPVLPPVDGLQQHFRTGCAALRSRRTRGRSVAARGWLRPISDNCKYDK